MPVLGRLDWIVRQLAKGREVHVSFGAARDAGKLKIKATLQPSSAGAIDPAVALGSTVLLAQVRYMLASNVAVDRGHKRD